jgi:hypothetical protein
LIFEEQIAAIINGSPAIRYIPDEESGDVASIRSI